jgi:hypothetical protein
MFKEGQSNNSQAVTLPMQFRVLCFMQYQQQLTAAVRHNTTSAAHEMSLITRNLVGVTSLNCQLD